MTVERAVLEDTARAVRLAVWILMFILAVLPARAVAQAEVKPYRGAPALYLDGRPVPPFAYMSYLGREPYYREAAGAGLHLYCIPAYLGDRGINIHSGIGPFRPALWRGEGEFDFSSLGDEFQTLLRADPQARVVIRLHLDPPQWWERAHPEGCARLPDGTTLRQCFAAPAWREATAGALRATLAWLRQSPYASHLIGIHLAAGGTEEWVYHYLDAFHDENPARTSAYRDWLRQAYQGDTQALRVAWGDPEAGFTTARPAEISGGAPEERWRDPQRERATLDTLRFHSATLADDIAYFCHIVKQESRGRLLTGAFYGYHFFVTDPRKGHFALGRLLECPDLDYLSSPNAYRRELGEDWPPMAALASVALHGKLWLAENDTRTFRTTLLKDQAPAICPPGAYANGVWLGPASAEDSVALLRKNTARMLAGGYGGWWFDMWGGWFSDPRLLAVLRRTQELGAQDLAEGTTDKPVELAMAAQVAVIVDEELCLRDASFGALTEKILANRYSLGKAGAPYDLYLRGDLSRLPAGRYRFVWLLGLPELTGPEQAWVAGGRAAGMTVAWTTPDGFRLLPPGAGQAPAPEPQIQLTPVRLRQLWRQAGVHLYVDSDDVINAGRGWLGLHTVAGGERVVTFPFPARVTDAFTGVALADASTSLTLSLSPRSTTLLRVRKAQPR